MTLPIRATVPHADAMGHPRIVTVGIDGSDTGATALAWAAREADRRTAGLRVVHAYTVPVYGGDFGAAIAFPSVDVQAFHQAHERVASEQLRTVRDAYPGLQIETRVSSGLAVGKVVEAAQDAELVVVGSSGAGSIAALLLGSVAHGVAHRAPCPVVLVPGGPLRPVVGRIVVGTDGSPAAAHAVEWADEEARLWNAELTVAHAWDYPYAATRIGPDSAAAMMEADARRLLDGAAGRITAAAGRPAVHTVLLYGSPATALTGVAADCDLLVLGARGVGALRAALLGSTSNAAIHDAGCPIAVVHAAPDQHS